MNYYLLIFNILAWPLIHLTVSWCALRRSADSFDLNSWLYRPRSWEGQGRIYNSLFRVKSWKKSLPDGAAWFSGGFSKKTVNSRKPEYLNRFLIETCRGEWTHWVTVSTLPLFLIVNPPWAQWTMTLYAIAFNFPCIIAQRFNRHHLLKILAPIRIKLDTDHKQSL